MDYKEQSKQERIGYIKKLMHQADYAKLLDKCNAETIDGVANSLHEKAGRFVVYDTSLTPTFIRECSWWLSWRSTTLATSRR